jgi:hypothetical protein
LAELCQLIFRVLAFVIGADPGVDRYSHHCSPWFRKGPFIPC